MSLFQHCCIALALSFSCLPILAAPRELAPLPPLPLPLPPLGAGAAASAADGKAWGLADCWNALAELRSCTNEIVLFFLNGDSYLSLPCCRAIRVVTRDCWPAMMASLGFTSEEADILRGYCDVGADAPPPSPSAANVPAPAGTPAAVSGYGTEG